MEVPRGWVFLCEVSAALSSCSMPAFVLPCSLPPWPWAIPLQPKRHRCLRCSSETQRDENVNWQANGALDRMVGCNKSLRNWKRKGQFIKISTTPSPSKWRHIYGNLLGSGRSFSSGDFRNNLRVYAEDIFTTAIPGFLLAQILKKITHATWRTQ